MNNSGTIQNNNPSVGGFTPSTIIPASSVGNTQPYASPNTQNDDSAHNALTAAITPSGNDMENNRNSDLNNLFGLESNFNPDAETNSLNESSGVNSAQASRDSYDTQMSQVSQNYDMLIERAQRNSASEGGGATLGGVDQKVRMLQIEKNNALAPLAILQSAATNNLTRLTDLVTKKVNADTSSIQARINAYKDHISAIDADPQEKAQMQAQADARQSRLEQVKTASTDAIKNAAQNGAPQSVLAAISAKASDPNATAADVMGAAGRWGIDKSAQLADQERALNIQKMKNDISAAGANQMSDDQTNFWAQAGSSGVNMNSLLPSVGMGSAAVAIKMKLLSKIADNANTLGISGSDFAAMISDSKAMQKAQLQVQSQGAMATINEKTASGYFDTLNTLATKVDASTLKTSMPIVDEWLRTGSLKLTGNADVNNFNAQLTEALTEYSKVMSGQNTGAGVTQYASEVAAGLLSKGFSASTIKSFVNLAKQNMSTRLSAYNSASKSLFSNIKSVTSPDNQGGLGTNSNTAFQITRDNTTINGLTVNIQGQGTITLPDQAAVDKFKKDHGL